MALRYVGKEAKEIAAGGLSLEEYYGFEGGDLRRLILFENLFKPRQRRLLPSVLLLTSAVFIFCLKAVL